MNMRLRDLNIKLSYAGKGDEILRDFLLPSINASVSYDRITSFYTIDSLLAISQGIQSLYEKRGKMRLIIGVHSFPSEFIEASLKQEYLQAQIVKIRENVVTGIQSLTDSLKKERLATIAWMIQDNLLEVKAAAVKGDGIFHPKTLILTDDNGDRIVAVGSPNETGSGLGGNFEQIMVAESWNTPEAVAIQESFFESLWNNQDEDAITYDISEETAEIILSALGSEYKNRQSKSQLTTCDSILAISAKMIANFFVSGDIPSLYMHQERAVIDALSRWPVRVLFSDEVGLGKTFEVAATMVYLTKYCGIKRTVILTPKSVLQQWQDELHGHFHINAWLYDSSNRTYVDPNGCIIQIGQQNPLGGNTPQVILMSAQLARGSSGNGSMFDFPDTVLPDLLIVDEAHSARVSKGLSSGTHKTRLYSMLESVSRKIPHIILATATPMQKDADEYHAMLKLLGLPKAWQKPRNYQTSLRLIASNDIPDFSDAYAAADLLLNTISSMKPSTKRLGVEEIRVLEGLIDLGDSVDYYEIGKYVQEHWVQLRVVFIKLHPAHLLTIRNTRRSLMQVGYRFPKRNLFEESIEDSMEIQLFYDKVNEYLTSECFSVEDALYPNNKRSVGFVRVSYQQRVASSLFSCKKSLERRLEKVNEIKKRIDYNYETKSYYDCLGLGDALDDIDLDDQLSADSDEVIIETTTSIDIKALRRAVGIESTALNSLCNQADSLLKSCGDMKICRSIRLANECLNKGDTVLLFSRYTDTIDALLHEFERIGMSNKFVYGIYTGKTAEIIDGTRREYCDKSTIKKELFSGRLRIMFCSDAASEGLNLQAARVLINVDVPWTPARLEQRIGRIARLGQIAAEVDIYNVWYPYSIEARMYHRIQRRLNETNLAIGEFPEIVATNIKLAVLDDKDDEKTELDQLNEIRNSFQLEALEELWSSEGEKITVSKIMRNYLMALCNQNFKNIGSILNDTIKKYILPDGQEVSLTATEGMAESISLQSAPWEQIDFKSNEIQVIRDTLNRAVVFATTDKNNPILIRHSSVIKLLLNEHLKEDDILNGYPQSLPDATKLDLSYSIDCSVQKRPNVWL